MTDAEIVAYNAGVAAYKHLGRTTFTADDLQRSLSEVCEPRHVTARDRLGEVMFLGWAEKGAWDAKAKVVR